MLYWSIERKKHDKNLIINIRLSPMCNNYSMMFFCYLLLLNAMMIKFTENNSPHALKMKLYDYLLINKCMISNYLFTGSWIFAILFINKPAPMVILDEMALHGSSQKNWFSIDERMDLKLFLMFLDIHFFFSSFFFFFFFLFHYRYHFLNNRDYSPEIFQSSCYSCHRVHRFFMPILSNSDDWKWIVLLLVFFVP